MPPSALPVVGVKDINRDSLKTTGELLNMDSPIGVMTRTVYDPAGIDSSVQVVEAVILDTSVTTQGYIPIVMFTGRGGKLLLNRTSMLDESPKKLLGNISVINGVSDLEYTKVHCGNAHLAVTPFVVTIISAEYSFVVMLLQTAGTMQMMFE